MHDRQRAMSPLSQLRSYRNNGAQIRYLKAQPRRLEPNDRELLDHLLRHPIDFMDSERFHAPDAEQEIFDDSINIPDPEISWYTPVMIDLGLPRSSRRRVQEQVKRLTGVQERILFYRFNYAKFRARKIQDELNVIEEQPLTINASEAQARDLIKWYRLSEKLREQIAETNVGLVLAMIRRTSMRNVDVTDMVSEGNMALLRAINKFNPDYGFKFSTYACQSILKAFSRLALRTAKHKDRFPIEHDASLEHTHSIDYRGRERDAGFVEALENVLSKNRGRLTDVEMTVVRRRFGIGEEKTERQMTLAEVGQTIGVGKERVRQIQLSAMSKLRRAMESEIDGQPESR